MQKPTLALLLAISMLSAEPTSLIERALTRQRHLQDSLRQEQMQIRTNHGWNSTSTQQRSRAGTGSITGILADSNGTILTSKSISIYDIYGKEITYKSTDYATGSFSFTGLSAGDYTLKAYNGNHSFWYGGSQISYDAKFITIDSSETENIGTMTIGVDQPRDTLKISGTLMDGKNPVVGSFLIHYSETEHEQVSRLFTTDTLGKFMVEITTSPGSQFCLITGSSIAPVWLGGEPVNASPSPVNLGDSTGGFVIPVTKAGVIKGTLSGLDTTSNFDIIAISEDGYELGTANQYINDSIFIITGLPEGSYYLKLDDWSHLFVEGYYPNSGTFTSAQKVTVTSGDTATVTFPIKRIPGGSTGRAYLRETVIDEHGVKVSGNLSISLKGSHTNQTQEIIYGTNVKVVSAGQPFTVSFTPSSDTLCKTYWNNGKDTTLAPEDTLDITIVVPSAGIIEGAMRDIQGNEIVYPSHPLVENVGLDYSITLENNSSESFSAYPRFFKKYRIAKVPAGTYDFHFVPGIEADGEFPANQMKGFVALNSGAVTIQKSDTLVRDLLLKPVSGIISGSIELPIRNGAFYVAEAIDRNGNAISYAVVYSSIGADTVNRYHHFIYRNRAIVNELLGEKTTPTNCNFSLPILPQGEYAIRIIDLQNIDTENEQYVEYWYGVSSSTILSGEALEDFESFGNITIPSGAKFVTLATDSTWIKGLNFGNTSIVSGKSVHGIGLKSFAVTNGTINCSFNLNGTTGSAVIYGLNGRKFASKSIADQSGSLAWKPALSAGAYVFEMIQGSKKITRKFMIQ